MGLSRTFEEKLEVVEQPHSNDILCGKNKECIEHPGSKDFRDAIERYVSRYQAADSKYMKMEITKQIYQDLSQQSKRFLKFNTKEGVWQELNSSSVRDKIGHALRFANKRKTKGSKEVSKKPAPRHRRNNSEISSSSTESAYSESSFPDSVVALKLVDPLVQKGFLPTDRSSSTTCHFQKQDDHYRPVTKVLERFGQCLPQIPRSLSFSVTDGLTDGLMAIAKDNSALDKKLSNREVLSILREPLVEFEPRTSVFEV
jgi:hypothetical protein